LAEGFADPGRRHAQEVDNGGNPIGLSDDGRVGLSDHDFGSIELARTALRNSFDDDA
jgi:hypothetical protein